MTYQNDEREAFEAAFNDAMGATDMPPDGFPGYDEWLFKRGWQAHAALLLDNELAEIEGRHLEKARAVLATVIVLPVAKVMS